jgi:RNA polymerase sigma factor (sigma-70 family)
MDGSPVASPVPPPHPGSVRVEESSRASFSSFYAITLSPLRSYLARILGNSNEAQDIAHDAYLKTYSTMQDRPLEKPRAFLFVTARHLAINYRFRRAERMQPTETTAVEEKLERGPGVVDEVIARQNAEALDRAILALPPGCRRVLLLRNTDQLSHEEIALRLGISRSNVEKHLARALRLLRKEITKNPE